MHYLSACNRDLFKSCYCYVLFLPNLSNIIKNIFNSIYLFLKKSFFVNTYEKQMYYEGNKSLFFDVMENGQIFPSKVCRFKYDHS